MMDEVTVGRRTFLKTMAILAGAIAAGPKVLASLEEAGAAGAAVSDQISYADFMNAVSYLEQSRVSSPPGGYVMILPPWLYADLMDSWDKYLREEFGMEDEMMLLEINPSRAQYLNTRTGKVLGVLIIYSEAIPEDEALISWRVVAEDATLTVGVEAT